MFLHLLRRPHRVRAARRPELAANWGCWAYPTHSTANRPSNPAARGKVCRPSPRAARIWFNSVTPSRNHTTCRWFSILVDVLEVGIEASLRPGRGRLGVRGVLPCFGNRENVGVEHSLAWNACVFWIGNGKVPVVSVSCPGRRSASPWALLHHRRRLLTNHSGWRQGRVAVDFVLVVVP